MSQIFQQKRNQPLLDPQNQIAAVSQPLKFAGLTLKEYFEKTQQVDKLNKIQEEQESQSELEYRCKEEGERKTNRRLKSLTRLKEYEFQLERTMINKQRMGKKISPNKKIDLNTEQSELCGKLPSIHHKSFSPQIKNLKLQIMTKFRQHCRIKTEIEDPIQNEIVLNQVMMKKRSNQPILVHITKKKFSCNPHKIQNNSNRNSERDKDVDGFMMTFSKIRERKHSDINAFESVKKTKRY